jgi:hypothetical protein
MHSKRRSHFNQLPRIKENDASMIRAITDIPHVRYLWLSGIQQYSLTG